MELDTEQLCSAKKDLDNYNASYATGPPCLKQ